MTGLTCGKLKARGGLQTEFCSSPMFGGWVEEEEPVRKEKPSRRHLRQESILRRTELSSERQLESPVNLRVEKKIVTVFGALEARGKEVVQGKSRLEQAEE